MAWSKKKLKGTIKGNRGKKPGKAAFKGNLDGYEKQKRFKPLSNKN
jgi:hypothetical protein